MKNLFKYLLDNYNITTTNLNSYEEYDDNGVCIRFSMFIPWSLCAEHSITADVIQPLLPDGWQAKASRRNIDVQEATLTQAIYAPSVAISQKADVADKFALFESGKLSKKETNK